MVVGDHGKKGDKDDVQISCLGNWINDELYSETGNKEIEQINRSDDKFRLKMPSLRYQ